MKLGIGDNPETTGWKHIVSRLWDNAQTNNNLQCSWFTGWDNKLPFYKKQVFCFSHCFLAECCNFLRTQPRCCCPYRKLLNYVFLVPPNPGLSASLSPFLFRLHLNLGKPLCPCSLISSLLQSVYSPLYAIQYAISTLDTVSLGMLALFLSHVQILPSLRGPVCAQSLPQQLQTSVISCQKSPITEQYWLSLGSRWICIVKQARRSTIHGCSYQERQKGLDPSKLRQGCWIQTSSL